ncbi:5-formyltetrahydrofolate cyclo-ligase [Nocardioides sp. zg-DK7169]|uniref:5-formyltetrahydrofolate cyclo-ligase n=1 Tax=Nocardioides sp. zg-DK7169 TaxID=2736600 RepID=UPI001552E0B4|nr:5-formyltetrahydrofolate cyclo-ligase [Nocardioides sp. zg-DK7169]NPC97383.1 5-formyltetrahydrofolate cyclo-ligase [Nocardioides sp. zg-DK7169]
MHPRFPPADASAAKTAVRDRLMTARRRLPLTDIGAASRAIAGHLVEAPEVARAATVAAYVSVGTEPGTTVLLEALTQAGRRVILPRLLPDGDLDWGTWRGEQSLAPARMGLLQPEDSLGVEAIATADAVLVPGLAVAPDGMRLGRGGGSYDRALGRVPAGTFTCVLLYDDEIGLDVPVEPHDRPVTAACSPAGLVRF